MQRHSDNGQSVRSGLRYQRYLQLRKQRRLRSTLWGIFAAALLVTSWDLTCRIDEVAYNIASPN